PRSRDAKTFEKTLVRVLESNLAALGDGHERARARAPSMAGSPPAGRYDLRYVNASMDLEKVVAALAVRRAGAEIEVAPTTLCLYGPPGSGKTAFVTHLADRLEAPLHTERA